MPKKLKVAVLMGGKSAEHEISLLSGHEVVKNLNPQKYQVLPIIISRDAKTWQIGQSNQNLLDSPTSNQNDARKRKDNNLSKLDYVSLVEDHKIDVVFIAMHGSFGEDGTIQAFLELIDMPYTGSGVLTSALGMDKIYSRKLFTQAGLKTPNFVTVEKGKSSSHVFKNLKSPVFVKPSNQGSSIGVAKVSKKNNLKKALNYAHRYSKVALIEKFIDGIEVTCAIIGNENPKALPLIEIVPKRDFFDYKAKYDERLTDEIVPARISKGTAKKAQGAALTAYKTLGCRGFGRVDMIIKGNDVYVLELNTIPGLTSVSLVPKAAKAAGISYPELLEKIISFASP